MRRFASVAAIALGLSTSTCGNETRNASLQDSASGEEVALTVGTTAEATFLKAAAARALGQIQAADMAQQKLGQGKLQQLSQRALNDFRVMHQQLRQIAAQRGITVVQHATAQEPYLCQPCVGQTGAALAEAYATYLAFELPRFANDFIFAGQVLGGDLQAWANAWVARLEGTLFLLPSAGAGLTVSYPHATPTFRRDTYYWPTYYPYGYGAYYPYGVAYYPYGYGSYYPYGTSYYPYRYGSYYPYGGVYYPYGYAGCAYCMTDVQDQELGDQPEVRTQGQELGDQQEVRTQGQQMQQKQQKQQVQQNHEQVMEEPDVVEAAAF